MRPPVKRRKRWNKKPHTLWTPERKARFPLGAEVESMITSYHGRPRIKAGDRGYITGRRTKNNTMLLLVRFGNHPPRLIIHNALTVVDLNPQQRIQEQRDYYKALTGE